MEKQTTYLHVPGLSSSGRSIEIDGWAFPPVGTHVKIHGYENRIFVVTGHELRIGHPDERPGVHVHLDDEHDLNIEEDPRPR